MKQLIIIFSVLVQSEIVFCQNLPQDLVNRELTTDIVKGIGCRRFTSEFWKHNDSQWKGTVQAQCPEKFIAVSGSCWRKSLAAGHTDSNYGSFIGQGPIEHGWQCQYKDADGIQIFLTCCQNG